jgi:hypothetical protein
MNLNKMDGNSYPIWCLVATLFVKKEKKSNDKLITQVLGGKYPKSWLSLLRKLRNKKNPWHSHRLQCACLRRTATCECQFFLVKIIVTDKHTDTQKESSIEAAQCISLNHLDFFCSTSLHVLVQGHSILRIVQLKFWSTPDIGWEKTFGK